MVGLPIVVKGRPSGKYDMDGADVVLYRAPELRIYAYYTLNECPQQRSCGLVNGRGNSGESSRILMPCTNYRGLGTEKKKRRKKME